MILSSFIQTERAFKMHPKYDLRLFSSEYYVLCFAQNYYKDIKENIESPNLKIQFETAPL